jgi:hypothetical protein
MQVSVSGSKSLGLGLGFQVSVSVGIPRLDNPAEVVSSDPAKRQNRSHGYPVSQVLFKTVE